MESNWNQAVEADSDIPQISESGSWFWRIMNKGEHVALQVSDKLLKPLTEAKYLNADNVSRYRCIMRIFFENYEKLKYWLYQEDIYEEMIKDPYFAEYKPEQCQQDLAMLVEWENLNTIQDTRKVASIEAFKNKKYRYQMSEYSVEIERLVLRLENLFIEGASLEPTLLERIRREIERFPEMSELDEDEVYIWWTDLNHDFVRLNQNYQDYMVFFYQIMKDTLDYRKWFEFQLFCQKSGERQKELTNSVFGTFSGGEKAMSMYVPLFSAVVAKYQGGRADAPRLISLDEAFAGVDNKNIRDMFRLMTEFQFDFIINSQVLWGDCDTLDALAIYQLIRPENAKFVTVMPYLWNGHKKELLEDEEKVEERGIEIEQAARI